MGQYYVGVNLDKKLRLEPRSHGEGIKLMEHSYMTVPLLAHVMHLLSAEWSKDRIVWAGDYGEGTFLPEVPNPEAENTFDVSRYRFEEQLPMQKDVSVSHLYYLANHTKKQYVDLRKCRKAQDGYTIHPLPLLTADGNGKGGGDYFKSNAYTGTWAGDSISAEFVPAFVDYEEIIPDFFE